MRMRTAVAALSVAVAMMGEAGAVYADDLRGAQRLLCSALQVTACKVGEECVVGAAMDWNIPQFIEIDLDRRVLSTTQASGENRETPIKSLERVDGLILIQGHEAGRAFSFVITEATGASSAAVARDGVTVGVFGACTPVSGKADEGGR